MSGVLGILVVALCMRNTSASFHLTPEDAVERLFGRSVDLDELVTEHLAKSPALAKSDRDRSRDARVEWIRDYRSFFPQENLDRLIRLNQSVFATQRSGDASLKYSLDLVMHRSVEMDDGWITQSLNNFWPSVANNESVPLDHVQEKFKDGYSLTIHRLQYRSGVLAEYCRALESIFGVQVDADLVIHPAEGRSGEVGRHVDFHADETIVVQLDGTQEIRLYRMVQPFANRHQEYAPTRDQLGSISQTLTLDEGDVLFIPRGFAYDSRAAKAISMSIDLRIRTSSLTYADGILVALRQLLDRAYDKDDFVLLRTVDARFSFVWSDVVATFIMVVADVTDELRELYPFKDVLISAMSNAGGTPLEPTEELRKRMERVVRASMKTSEAAFEPMLEVLANDATSDVYGGREIQKWAVLQMNGGPRVITSSFEVFRSCLETLLAHADLPTVHRAIVSRNDHFGVHISDRYADIYERIRKHESAWSADARLHATTAIQ